MDIFERLFGVSPDGGDGSLEFLCLVGVIVLVAAMIYLRHRSRSLAMKYDSSVKRQFLNR